MDYLDLDRSLTDREQSLREEARSFAEDVLRPTARDLDELSAGEMVDEDSPLWDCLDRAFEAGYHALTMPEEYGGAELSPREFHIVTEELTWGSYGLGATLFASGFPFQMAAEIGTEEMVDEYVRPFVESDDASMIGCWSITEPEHGSDTLASHVDSFDSGEVHWDVTAERRGGTWVLNGRKSDWVGNGTIATHALVHAGVDPSRGMAGCAMFFCPLDREGVSKPEPTDTLGARDLNQGGIVFDDVELPGDYQLVGPENYRQAFDSILATGNVGTGMLAMGIARASFEEALKYCKERVQGGKPLVEHPSVQKRLFDMFSRVELIRSISRRVAQYNMDPEVEVPFLEYGTVVKTRCTELIFEVAHDALQLHGGQGINTDNLIEKLFRDARMLMIADGANEALAISAGQLMIETYPRSS